MKKKSIGESVLVIGIIIIIISLMADILGIGEIIGLGQNPSFGPAQIGGVLVGIILGGIGWYLKEKK